MKHDQRICQSVQLDPRGQSWTAAERAHAASCQACAAMLAGVEALGGRLRSLPGLTGPMPDALRTTLLDQLAACPDAADAAVSRPAFRPAPRLRPVLVPLALAASLALGVVIGRNVDLAAPPATGEVRRNIGNYIYDVTHDHYLFSRVGRPLEVSITEPAGLSTWLSESLNFAVRVPGSSRDFRLEGGRLWHTVGRLSALAAYDVGGGKRALLFAVPAANLDLAGAESSLVRGRRVFRGRDWECDARVWIDGDLALALVAPEGALPESWAETFLP